MKRIAFFVSIDFFLMVLLRLALRPLFTVLGLLFRRTGTMSAGDILFLLCLGFHLVIAFGALGGALKHDAGFYNIVDIAHSRVINGGTSARP